MMKTFTLLCGNLFGTFCAKLYQDWPSFRL